MENNYEVIVVGAGHAGIEAGLASARMGVQTLLVTTNIDRIGYMSCNPAIGGLAKGHMVREIDALGGQMAITTDKSSIQFKRLNATKGPAVRGSRSQCDKDIYVSIMIDTIKKQKNLSLLQGEVKSLIIDRGECFGVILEDGSKIQSKKVIITTGTFMNAVMHVGEKTQAGGRVGDKATIGISDQLKEHGFNIFRLKTGTPPRLIKESIDFSQLSPQPGDKTPFPFSSFSEKKFYLPQVDCHLSYTNEKTHDLIRKNLQKSPMYCGIIEGVGPRYCPSIEDKIVRFSDKNRHQTFLEPEGLSTNLIYLQGISTSLPAEVQEEFVRSIVGLENVKFARYGYAVEYDFIEPTQIKHTLETVSIRNLFLAGQINGTSGYEEAASQGLLAGINAALQTLHKEELVLRREESYIGVLIDDLVTKGTKEPYRMFTSRAEFRLLLREDNTYDRLSEKGFNIGLLPAHRFNKLDNLRQKREGLKNQLSSTFLYPNEETNAALDSINTPRLSKPATLLELIKRSEVNFSSLEKLGHKVSDDPEVTEPLEIEIKYEGYIKKQKELVSQTIRLEGFRIPEEISYQSISGLSKEEVEKLSQIRPKTIGQAQRISGINPSAIQCILIHVKGRKKVHQLEV